MKSSVNRKRWLEVWKERFITFQKKILKLQDTPERIAKGFALGTFIGMTPFIGFQFVIAIFLARILYWNKFAAGIAVFQTNLLTGAFVFGFNFFIGAEILGVEQTLIFADNSELFSLSTIFGSGVSVLAAFLLGGFITGLPAAVLAYFLVRKLVVSRQEYLKSQKQNLVKTQEQQYAVVTGASKGLGLSIARELALRKVNLLLISLPNEGLEQVSSEIRKEFGIAVDGFEIDMTRADAFDQIHSWIGKRSVSILINNAGIGGSKSFDSVDSTYLNRMIQINIQSVSLLSWYLLPKLKEHDEAFILNVSSMASFSPIAYKTLYPASKAFVSNFSSCLNEELKDTGVFVSALCPGPMPTNSDVCARVNQQSRVARFGVKSAEEVAKIAVRDMLAHRKVIIPGFSNRLYRFLMGVVPGTIRIPLISSFVKRELHVSNAREIDMILSVK